MAPPTAEAEGAAPVGQRLGVHAVAEGAQVVVSTRQLVDQDGASGPTQNPAAKERHTTGRLLLWSN